MTTDPLFLDSFVRLLDDVVDPAAGRRLIQHGEGGAQIWRALQESGFLDAVVPEEHDGAGLSREEIAPLLLACGERLAPASVGHTMAARLIAATAGARLAVDGPVALWPVNAAGRLRSQLAPPRAEADYAVVQRGSTFTLQPLVAGGDDDGFGRPAATLDGAAAPLQQFELPGVDLLEWAAAVSALWMAGAISRVLEMTQRYVTERQQFGRPLGGFQVVQHLLAITAEQAVLAATAARIGVAGEGAALDPLRVATAKILTTSAAGEVARAAHALHGAIGITEEFDLQLYTRQLKRLQLSYGSEAYWSEQLGAARLAARDGTSVDFIRARIAPTAAGLEERPLAS
jgi:acyl-CoA dehydrogenase